MSARLPSTAGSAADDVRRLLQVQLQRVLAALGSHEASAHRVHAVRKAVRALRASIRLLQRALGRLQARTWDHQLRSAARALSPWRDQQALCERLQEWRTEVQRSGPAMDLVLRRLRADFLVQETDQRPGLTGTLVSVRGTMQDVARQVANAKIHDSWRRALRGHLISVDRERSAWIALSRNADDTHWHRWRRRSKDLDHQLRVLEPLCPPIISAWSKGWHQVSDLVGGIHDDTLLDAVVKRVLAGPSLSTTDHALMQELRSTLQRRRRNAERHARRLGRQLHAQDPRMTKSLFRRWRRLWCQASPSAEHT
jgi:CHAD domain-containing protein